MFWKRARLSMDNPGIQDYPMITIITVVYNGASYIENTINSVISQFYPNLNYFIIDGGSTDGTVDIIRKYENSISHWLSEKDGGIYDAMNKGWKIAEEDSFILFLGAGDRILSLPDDMRICATADVIYGRVTLGKDEFFMPRSDWRLRIYNSLHHQALLVRKSLHSSPPYDPKYPTYADFDFNQRLMKNCARFVYAESFHSFALAGGTSDSPNFKESLAVINKNFGMFWSFLAILGYMGVRYLPLAKRLRPIKSANQR